MIGLRKNYDYIDKRGWFEVKDLKIKVFTRYPPDILSNCVLMLYNE